MRFVWATLEQNPCRFYFHNKCLKYRKLALKLPIITKENLKMGAVAYLTNFFEILLPILAYKWPKFSYFFREVRDSRTSRGSVTFSQPGAVAYNQPPVIWPQYSVKLQLLTPPSWSVEEMSSNDMYFWCVGVIFRKKCNMTPGLKIPKFDP